MRQLFLALTTIIAIAFSLSSCEKETESIVDSATLPTAALNTINEHFDEDNIMLVTYDKALFDKEYTVVLTDGTVIDFNKSGSWESVKSTITGVPTSIIPTPINEYIASNYSDKLVVELDKDSTGYEVKLDNQIELKFNLSGVLTGVDLD
ncbi:MAG: PepSY-like domain-containing protein [Rikenellaceae bacterium]